MPPFSALSNDEDREHKAEFRKAGTYHVIVNPESFADLTEYKDYRDSPKSTPSQGPSSIHSDLFSSDQNLYSDTCDSENSTQASDDPDIVILKVFEDDTLKLVIPGDLSMQRRPSRTPTLSIPSSATSISRPDYFKFSYDNTPLIKMASKDGRDHELIFFYKTFVHRHLAQVHRDSLGTSLETGVLSAPDVFERHAANFLPVCCPLPALVRGSNRRDPDTLTVLALPRSDGIFCAEHVLQARQCKYRCVATLSTSAPVTASEST